MTTPNFQLTINLGNDAMQTASNIASALRRIADQLERHGELLEDDNRPIFDYNGSCVGVWSVEL